MKPALVAFGDTAWRASLPERANPRALLDELRAVRGVADVVVSEEDVLVVGISPDGSLRAAVEAALDRALRAGEDEDTAPRRHVVPVRYEGEDLEELSRGTGLSPRAIAAIHAAGDYVVASVGFLPGFAYLRGLDPRLVVPRRATPRPRVPALSVAIAGPYTGVYPFASPGGWSLVGTALDFDPFDPASGAALSLGDRVTFAARQR